MKLIKFLNFKSWVLIGLAVALLAIYLIFFYDPIDEPYRSEHVGLQVEPLVFEGRRIHFPYTDENEGESIIIKSDKKIYEGGDRSDVYFTLTNTSDKSEKVAILSYFPKEYGDISYIDVWNGEKWQAMSITRGDIKANMTKLKKAWEKKKPVPDKFDVKTGIQFEISAGHTAYFKAEITYPVDKEGEFWFEAFGDQGGYGLLDPIFVGGGTIIGGGTTIGQTTTSRDTPPGWYQASGNNWDYRRKITVDYKKVSGTSNLSNFPMLVNITATDLRTTGFGGKLASGSGEFIFTSSDGTTSIPYEIETYSSSSGQFIGWVNVTTLSVTQDTSIYMYYGGPAAGAATNQNKAGTWDSNFVGVWHLPNGTTLGALDSTSGANNGTITEAVAISGKVDGAGNFDGTNDSISIGDKITDALTNMSACAWVKHDTISSDDDIFAKQTSNEGFVIFRDDVGAVSGRTDIYSIYIQETAAAGGTSARLESATGTTLTNTWTHLCVTLTLNNSTGLNMYINGVKTSDSPLTTANIGNINAGTAALTIGSPRFFDGQIDEARISDSIRSADWIKTEYNNQFKPSSFYLVGGLEKRN